MRGKRLILAAPFALETTVLSLSAAVEAAEDRIDKGGGAFALPVMGRIPIRAGTLSSIAQLSFHTVETPLCEGLFYLHPFGRAVTSETQKRRDQWAAARLERAATLSLAQDRPDVQPSLLAQPAVHVPEPSGRGCIG